MDRDPRRPSARSLRALDYLNIFLADVRDGIGPYLAIYLLATQHWDPASIGVAMSAMGIATVVAQTPCGALIDAFKQKRLLIAVAALLVGVSCAAITIFPTFGFIMIAQALNGIAAAIFPPAVAAITLGIVGPKKFAARMGRNEAFNHAGNVGAAALAGLAAIAGASIISVSFIKERDIDHDLARAAIPHTSQKNEVVSGITALLAHREILIFALAVTLFHFANAAMLPLEFSPVIRKRTNFLFRLTVDKNGHRHSSQMARTNTRPTTSITAQVTP